MKDSGVGELLEEVDEIRDVDDLNAVLDALYDLADVERVWIQ
ncbi:hypothetical protein [Zhihengliuella halotolerans]|nr:hypothetical protein [Zhihengliuella halotolerans]